MAVRIVIIVQARMGSTRLPGKVMKKVLDKPLLAYLIERLQRCERTDELVIATTDQQVDNPIANLCESLGVECFRGDEHDVLKRYYDCAKEYKADAVVRLTADCPLMDRLVVDTEAAIFRRAYPDLDYISNVRVRSFPRGMDCEVFSFEALEKAYNEAQHEFQREHVTPFIYLNQKRFAVADYVSAMGNFSDYRLTVDEAADFRLIKKVIETLYPTKKDFGMNDIVLLFEEYPEWLKINASVEQKKLEL